MKPIFILLSTQIKQKQLASERSDQGLTLIESLAAIVITGIILSAMAPPLLFSAATRIQSQRVEQAEAIARQEVDRVRSFYARKKGVPKSEETGKVPATSNTSPLGDTTAPTEVITGREGMDNPNKALLIDADGDGKNNFFIQLIRDPGMRFSSGAAGDQLAVFQMGVRVYDIAAEDNLEDLNTAPASLQMTQSLGERTTNPLAVTYTEISRSDLRLSLDEYRRYLCDVKEDLTACN